MRYSATTSPRSSRCFHRDRCVRSRETSQQRTSTVRLRESPATTNREISCANLITTTWKEQSTITHAMPVSSIATHSPPNEVNIVDFENAFADVEHKSTHATLHPNVSEKHGNTHVPPLPCQAGKGRQHGRDVAVPLLSGEVQGRLAIPTRPSEGGRACMHACMSDFGWWPCSARCQRQSHPAWKAGLQWRQPSHV